MKPAQILRSRISDPTQVTTGMIVTYHLWSGVFELAKRADLDYIIIDLEHLSHDASLVADICAMGRRENYPVLIRPAALDFTLVRLAMDLGPCGLLVPNIESREDMEKIQEAIYLRPRGQRRPGGLGNYWVSDFNYDTWKTEVEDHVVILPQIESKLGLQNLQEIASHPITTAMAVGPYDLSADLGVCFDPNAPVLKDALSQIKAAAEAENKNMWMIGDGPTLVSEGYNFVCITEPIMFLESQLRQTNHKTKGTAAAANNLVLP